MDSQSMVERDKYARVWNDERYRKSPSPGEASVKVAIHMAAMTVGSSVIDYGCGDGRAVRQFVARGFQAMGVDISPCAYRPNEVGPTPLMMEASLWDLPPLRSDYSFCVDVMEHIPTDRVEDVLRGIVDRTRKGSFFQIAMFPDHFGMEIIDQHLHLTLWTKEQWEEAIRKFVGYSNVRSWVNTAHGPEYPYFCAVAR